jgi:hypothetical protein
MNSQNNLSQVDLSKTINSKAKIALSPYFTKSPEIMINIKNKYGSKFACLQEVNMKFNINTDDLKPLVWKRRGYDKAFDFILTSLNSLKPKATFFTANLPLVKVTSDKNGCAIITFAKKSTNFNIPERISYSDAFKTPILKQYDLFISESLSDEKNIFNNTAKSINAGKELWQYLQIDNQAISGRYLEIPVQDLTGLNYKLIVKIADIIQPKNILLSNKPYIKKFDINVIGCFPFNNKSEVLSTTKRPDHAKEEILVAKNRIESNRDRLSRVENAGD